MPRPPGNANSVEFDPSQQNDSRLGKNIVNTYVLPVNTYAAHVWCYLAVTLRKVLSKVKWCSRLNLTTKVPHRLSHKLLREGLSLRSANDNLMRLGKFCERTARNTHLLIAAEEIPPRARWLLEAIWFASPVTNNESLRHSCKITNSPIVGLGGRSHVSESGILNIVQHLS